MLAANVTVPYNTTWTRNLVRTGTIGDGSCFFHSCLHAISSSYRSMDVGRRVGLVSTIRRTISEQFTKKDWIDMNDASKSLVNLKFRQVLEKFIKDLTKVDLKNERVRSVLLDEPIDLLSRTITPNFLDSMLGKTWDDCRESRIDTIFDTIMRKLDKEKIVDDKRYDRYIKEKRNICLRYLYEISFDEAYKEFKGRLLDSWVDFHMMEMLQRRLKRNIYFIDEESKEPIKTSIGDESLSIVLLWVQGSHYEVLGRQMDDGSIERQFKNDDPLIIKIRSLLL